jgi:hypothetical protein
MNNYPTVQKFGLNIPLKSLSEQRFNSPSVSSIEDQNLLVFLVKLIAEIYFKCGNNINDKELKAISIAFKDELKMFPFLTLAELNKAFQQGYKERYGKYYGLSIKTFVQWLDSYIQNERNEDLNKAKKEKKKPELSEEEKKMYVKSGMTKCFEHWEKERAILDGYTLFLYDILYDDYLPKDKESKLKFYEDAKTVLEFEAHNRKPKSRSEHLELKELLNEINKDKSVKIINKAKELVVSNFLRKASPEILKEIKEKYEIT